MGICLALLFTELSRDVAWKSAPDDCDNRGAWIYQRLFLDNAPIDLAIIGTSRTINGIQDTLISKMLSTSNKIEVANLGYCRFGTEIQFIITKDLISQKKVKTIVFEINEGLSGTSHPMYPYYSTTEDLLKPASYLNQAMPANYYNGFLGRLAQFRQSVLQVPVDSNAALPSYGYRGYPGLADSNTLHEPNASISKTPNMIQRFDKIYPESWISKSIALCKANGVNVYFLYLPSYHDQPEPKEELAFYRSYATVLIPPNDMIHHKNLWRDHDHLNDAGASIMSAWLVQQLEIKP